MKKLLISSIFGVAVAATFIAFFLKSPAPLLQNALQAFLDKNYSSSVEILSTIKNEKETFIPSGFLAQAQGDFATSSLYFQKALLSIQKENSFQDIFLGLALNAYFLNQPKEMLFFLEKAEKLAPKEGMSSGLSLVRGLQHYINKEFSSAEKYFISYLQNNSGTSTWLTGSFDKCFSKESLEIRLAYALTEQRKIAEAREILEKMVQYPPLPPIEKSLATLFLGVTYLKEGSELPLIEQTSYFKVALCYLKRSKLDCLSPYEKNFLQEALFQESYRLLMAKELSPLVFEAIHLLEKWHSIPSLEKLADKLALTIVEEESAHFSTSLALCTTLAEAFHNYPFQNLLTQKFCHYFTKKMQERSIQNPSELWQKLEILNPSIDEGFKKNIAQLTGEEILRLFHEEGSSLKKSLTYLKFWKNIENTPEKKHAFASMLFSYGIYYWKKEKQEHKGSALLKLALHLSDEDQKKTFLQDLEAFFVALYNSARDANMVARLPLIYDAFDDFKVSFKRLLNPDELANHLADAAYLLSAQNYLAAKVHAEWVLKMEPQNQLGLKLLGLAAFHLGDFFEAKKALEKVVVYDEEVAKALMLSEVFYSTEDEKTLVQLDIIHALECE